MNYSTNLIYGKNEAKPLEWTWERPKLWSEAKTYTHAKTQDNTFVVCIVVGLVVIQASVMDVNLGYTR